MMFCCTNVFSGKMINFAFNRINWSVCEQILTVHCLPSKGLSLVGWILGALFCVNMMIFLTRPKESGVVNISHYTRLSTRREHTQWTILFSFSLSICLSLTFPPIFSLFLFLCHTLQSVFKAFILLAKFGKEHCSNQACWTQIRKTHWKIFYWHVIIWMKSKAEFFFNLIIDLIMKRIVSGSFH